jgi:hypothetical protein
MSAKLSPFMALIRDPLTAIRNRVSIIEPAIADAADYYNGAPTDRDDVPKAMEGIRSALQAAANKAINDAALEKRRMPLPSREAVWPSSATKAVYARELRSRASADASRNVLKPSPKRRRPPPARSGRRPSNPRLIRRCRRQSCPRSRSGPAINQIGPVNGEIPQTRIA